MSEKPKPTSAREIEVPGIFERGPVPSNDMSLLEQLIAMKVSFGPKPNKNELAAVLIIACIEGGVRHKSGIVDLVSRAGLNPKHVGAYRARWTREADGRYQTIRA